MTRATAPHSSRPLGAAGWLAHPSWLVGKLVARWRRCRATPRYRLRLAADTYLPAGLPPPKDLVVSVVMPVFRVAEDHLRAAIASVRAQTHTDWELLALDDASPDPHVARVLAEAAREDPRIRIFSGSTNLGIALASNRLIDSAGGDFVAFLDHDDLLHPRALEMAARLLTARPDADWIFSDEDKVGDEGLHHEPCFKPGFSPHLLLAFNLVAHLRVIRRELLVRLDGHRPGFDGAQDYELALRALAHGATFVHLPGVFYHWRMTARSMARGAAAKPRANLHALRALTAHVEGWPSGGATATAELIAASSLFRVRRGADQSLRVASVIPIDTEPQRSGTPTREVHPLQADHPSSMAGLVEAARRTSADVVVGGTAAGMAAGALEELLALLQVPGTAVSAGRVVGRRRVMASGVRADATGAFYDPWAGLHRGDPGYLNLALIPSPRAVLPPLGWAAWRDDLVAAWDAAADAPTEWRLAVGLLRLRRESVVAPEVEFAPEPAASLLLAPPPQVGAWPRDQRGWVEDLGLEPHQARMRREE
ncbi:MAG: glycosyltransferase family 2 protein [Acidobacteriota bacterium]